ncbi:Gfo/Idh/MocA family oxidoreductase [Candidatus Sumerlaeota bacterium]|nr:Gfo/Idh/MocA family oxidoreductase [Candidatus Sumerlaeota bacterium]
MKTAIIGFGRAAEEIHLPALRMIEKVHLLAAADPDPSRAAAARQAGIGFFTSPSQLLGETRPELVVVASPPSLHLEHVTLALNAGAHVLCEKPMAASAAEADEMIRAASEANRILCVNHEFNLMPIFESVLLKLRAPGEPPPSAARVWQNIFLPPSDDAGWRKGIRHRTLFDAGIHLIHFLGLAFGEVPAKVWASISRDEAGADTHVSATLEFSRGRIAQLYMARLSKGRRDYFDAQVDTSEKTYRASFGGVARFSAGLDHSSRPAVRLDWGASGMAWEEKFDFRRVIARNPSNPNATATSKLITQMIHAIETGGENPCGGKPARDALAAAAACYLSDELGRTIHLAGQDAAMARDYRMGDAGNGK